MKKLMLLIILLLGAGLAHAGPLGQTGLDAVLLQELDGRNFFDFSGKNFAGGSTHVLTYKKLLYFDLAAAENTENGEGSGMAGFSMDFLGLAEKNGWIYNLPERLILGPYVYWDFSDEKGRSGFYLGYAFGG